MFIFKDLCSSWYKLMVYKAPSCIAAHQLIMITIQMVPYSYVNNYLYLPFMCQMSVDAQQGGARIWQYSHEARRPRSPGGSLSIVKGKLPNPKIKEAAWFLYRVANKNKHQRCPVWKESTAPQRPPYHITTPFAIKSWSISRHHAASNLSSINLSNFPIPCFLIVPKRWETEHSVSWIRSGTIRIVMPICRMRSCCFRHRPQEKVDQWYDFPKTRI